MTRRQRAEIVRFVTLQDVGLQQCVVRDTAQFNAVIGKHMAIIFEMLANFFMRRRFQPGLEFHQHLINRQLFRCTGIVVAER